MSIKKRKGSTSSSKRRATKKRTSTASKAVNTRKSASPNSKRRAAPKKSTGRRKVRRKNNLLRGENSATYWTVVTGLWAAIGVFVLFSFFTLHLEDPLAIGRDNTNQRIKIVSASGQTLSANAGQHNYVYLDEMPNHLIDAVLAAEDRRFYTHFGIDPLGMMRASLANYSAGKVVQGGSTITQQLAKNLYLTSNRTIVRKVQEVSLAFWLEWRLTKNEILELYLNHVYFGAGAHGIGKAAKRYFDRPANTLTLLQSATLAGLLKAPSRYAPTRNAKGAKARAKLVLQAMVDTNKISKKTAERTLKSQSNMDLLATSETGYGFVIDQVKERLPGFIDETRSDLIIETTIDHKLQTYVQATLARIMAGASEMISADQSAAIIIDNKGAVKAIVGSRSYKESPFNRVVKAKRQPGSAFKPFIYLNAIERGMSPEDIVVDRPVKIAKWQPQNYSRNYRGAITLRQSLAHSVNTVAVRLMHQSGPKATIRTARRLGIKSRLHNNPSLALGTGEVSLLELTSAYAPFANGGYGILPHIIKRIKTTDGKVLYNRSGKGPGRVIGKQHLQQMRVMLQDVVRYGTGRTAALKKHKVFGKTGTSQGFRDAWFVGFAGNLTAGVWVGNDDGRSMQNVTGSDLPAKIWQNVMAKALRTKSPKRSGRKQFSQLAR